MIQKSYFCHALTQAPGRFHIIIETHLRVITQVSTAKVGGPSNKTHPICRIELFPLENLHMHRRLPDLAPMIDLTT